MKKTGYKKSREAVPLKPLPLFHKHAVSYCLRLLLCRPTVWYIKGPVSVHRGTCIQKLNKRGFSVNMQLQFSFSVNIGSFFGVQLTPC